jgi:hypothetical protein
LKEVYATHPDSTVLFHAPINNLFHLRASTLESTLRQAGRRLALGLNGGVVGLATDLTALLTGMAG